MPPRKVKAVKAVELEKVKVLLKELAKVKEPVKTQRRANKKQTALRVEDFISKSKSKDQVTQLLDGIRIKRALDNQYKKLVLCMHNDSLFMCSQLSLLCILIVVDVY